MITSLKMEIKEEGSALKRSSWLDVRHKIDLLVMRFKELQGDPHYVAMGMAVGIFVSITPTIPFHTALAIVMAFIFRGSKPAAVIGCWFSNPITIPFFYFASYEVGMLMLGESSTDFNTVMTMLEVLGNSDVSFSVKYQVLITFCEKKIDVIMAMIAGGAVLGVVPGVAGYFITRKLVRNIHSSTT